MEECHGPLRTATPRCDDIVLAIVTLLRGRHSQTAYVHAIITPDNSCLWVPCILAQHSPLSSEWISQTTGRLHTVKLIPEPNPYLPALVIHANPTYANPCVTNNYMILCSNRYTAFHTYIMSNLTCHWEIDYRNLSEFIGGFSDNFR